MCVCVCVASLTEDSCLGGTSFRAQSAFSPLQTVTSLFWKGLPRVNQFPTRRDPSDLQREPRTRFAGLPPFLGGCPRSFQNVWSC